METFFAKVFKNRTHHGDVNYSCGLLS
uniref:Uncharacterized protein n=1 Tax=Anguilla anguilla TaxID=7936 RepID=A0A0E9RXP5_ANGAN